MFFILSKTLNFLVMPLTVVMILLVLSVVIKKDPWRRRCFWAGLGLMIFFSNDFISNEVMRAWEVRAKPFQNVAPHALGIVLTGATLTGLSPDDRVYFQRGADRVTHTVQLYKMGLIKKILISGGTGLLTSEEEPEADKFKKVMVMMDVPEEDILIENGTRNTHESAVAVKAMLAALDFADEDCLLITSAFHMRRSLACYRKVGLDLEPFSTDFYTHPTVYYPDAFLVPRLEAMMLWQKLVKEWVGMAAYKVAGYI
jgi:uncharacterized SAM-binding protein YcdF (DUF218 family)